MPIIQDWASLSNHLEAGVKTILNDLIDGSIKDLDGPIRETAQRLTIAARRRRQDLIDEAQDQLGLIVLEKELRLKAAGSGLFESALSIGLNALVNGAIGGLGALKSA